MGEDHCFDVPDPFRNGRRNEHRKGGDDIRYEKQGA